MTKDQLESFLYATWWACRGFEPAKHTLWALVGTQRKRIILAKLKRLGVRVSDWDDAHSNIGLKIYHKIELLEEARAYTGFEAMFVSEEARRWRELYGHFVEEPVENVLEQAGGVQ
jgi:hypothetical protein